MARVTELPLGRTHTFSRERAEAVTGIEAGQKTLVTNFPEMGWIRKCRLEVTSRR